MTETLRSDGPESLPHIQAAEAVLGVPLTTGASFAFTDGTESIRTYAYNATIAAIRDTIGAGALRDNAFELDSTQADVVRERHASLGQIAAMLSAANHTLEQWHAPVQPAEADDASTARAIKQSRAVGAIATHSQRAPGQNAGSSSYRDGLLIVAPPGAGKTALHAQTHLLAGVGLPISAYDDRPRRGVGVLNSKVLIRQYLDPSETFKRWLGSAQDRQLRVGAFYSDRHDGHDEYDIILTTPESYATAVERGAIRPETTVRWGFDEAHRTALAPSMQQRIVQFDSGLYLFTFTPAIDRGRRDLRTQYPHAVFGTMREFSQDGIISPYELYTYRATAEAGSAERIAISLATNYVQQGYKTLIVCQPGNNLEQARNIADALNARFKDGQITPHHSFGHNNDKIAGAIGMFPGSQTEESIQQLRRGELLIITTVATAKEGLNIPDLKALVIIGPQGANWEVDQWAGRTSRLNGQVAIVSEILPATINKGRPLASIFHTFGLLEGEIEGGYYIGPPREPAGHGGQSGPGERKPSRPYTPPAELIGFLVVGESVREATIAPADLAKRPPADYQVLDGIRPEGVPIEWLFMELERQSAKNPAIRYVGSWEWDPELEEVRYQRFYSPAAFQYFDAHPIPQLAGEADFSSEDIANMLNVSRRYVLSIIEGLDIQPLPRLNMHNRSAKYYGIDELSRIKAEVAKTPQAESTDEVVADIAASLTQDFVEAQIIRSGIQATPKHRHPDWGKTGISRHVSATDADTLRHAYFSLEVADPLRLIGLQEIAARAGISLSLALTKWNAVPDGQKPPEAWRRSQPKARPTIFMPRTWGEEFIQYIKPEKLLPWDISMPGLSKYFGRTSNAMYRYIKDYNPPGTLWPVNLAGGTTVKVFPISAIEDMLQIGLKPADGMPLFVPGRAATAVEHIGDRRRIDYSRQFQLHVMAEQVLAPVTEIAHYHNRRVVPPVLPSLGASHKDGAISMEALRLDLGCSPEAFIYMLKEAGVSAPAHGGITPTTAAQLRMRCEVLNSPFPLWESLETVAEHHACPPESIMEIVDILQQDGRLSRGQDDIRLAREDGSIALFFSAGARRRLRIAFEQNL